MSGATRNLELTKNMWEDHGGDTEYAAIALGSRVSWDAGTCGVLELVPVCRETSYIYTVLFSLLPSPAVSHL